MPKLMYDFWCVLCERSFEDFVDTTVKALDCPSCGHSALRSISRGYLPIRMGVDTDLPTMADKWAKLQTAKNSGRIRDNANHESGNQLNYDD
jgi:putative FmdB family regulatory protein